MRWRRQAAATVAFTVIVKAALLLFTTNVAAILASGIVVMALHRVRRASGIMVSGRTALGGGPRPAQLRKCSDVIGKGQA